MGQNTNHLPTHPIVEEALLRAVREQMFNLYAPPTGIEELKELVLNDIVGTDRSAQTGALITDGAVEGLYLVSKRLSDESTTFITSDPTWVWPIKFSENEGATIVRLPIYNTANNFKISPDQLDAELKGGSKSILYLVDPLNPLGSSYDEAEIRAIAALAKKYDAIVIHDCTYRDFAFEHFLVRDFYPEKTITTYSFSKWLGIAGLRTGAIIADRPLLDYLIDDQPNILGSNIVGQIAAIAAFKIKAEWIDSINVAQRRNQKEIKNTFDLFRGFKPIVYPSNGNFISVDCTESAVTTEHLAGKLLERNIFVRTSDYHSDNLKNTFLKISTTVPEEWTDQLCSALRDIIPDESV
tara:strand:- start:2024 stop:3082 length:1059 start_codon:yes stop_codon:yes gene_type:complete